MSNSINFYNEETGEWEPIDYIGGISIEDVTVDGVSVLGADKVARVDLSGKLNISQGVANANKFVVTDDDGNTTTRAIEFLEGGSY